MSFVFVAGRHLLAAQRPDDNPDAFRDAPLFAFAQFIQVDFCSNRSLHDYAGTGSTRNDVLFFCVSCCKLVLYITLRSDTQPLKLFSRDLRVEKRPVISCLAQT